MKSAGTHRWASDLGIVGGYRALAMAVDLASLAVLMQLLGPTPFGQVAMAEAALTIAAGVGDAGVGSALVSDPQRGSRRISAALLVALALGGAISALCIAATPLIESIYADSAVVLPWLVLSAAWSVSLLPAVPQALLQIDGRFDLIGRIHLGTTVLAAAASISLAMFLPGVWPLLVRRIVLLATSLAGLMLAARPQLGAPTRADIVSVLVFARGVIGFNLVNALARNLDKVLIGRYLGDTALGLYTAAYRVLVVPLGQIGSALSTVALPRLAKLMPDGPALAKALAELMRATMIFVAPGLIAVAATSTAIVEVFLGPSWIGSDGPLQVLALLAVYQVPIALSGLAFMATRRTGLMFAWSLFSTPFVVASFVAGLAHGIVGVAVAYALTSLMLAPFLIWAVARACNAEVAIFYRALGRGMVGALVCSSPLLAGDWAVRMLAPGGPGTLVIFALAAGAGTWLAWRWIRGRQVVAT